ncbi:MAG: ABC transporter permease [Candidatus Hydrogenedentes bacterium]|nr:ABC transporter permease [Candidatus Hydrogenedentota bacterium]
MNQAPSPTLTLIKRELLTALRSWKSLVLLLLLLGVLYYMAFAAMDQMSANYFSAARLMQNIFNVQVGLMLFCAMTIVPATAAVSLSRERADGSYDLLLTTLIPPSRIALGKLAATLIVFLLIGIALLPFTGLVYFFAGVDVYRFFQAAAVILPTALACAALGLWVSTLFENPARGIFVTFGLVLLADVILPLLLSWQLDTAFFATVMMPFALLWDRVTLNADWAAYGIFAGYQGLLALIAFLATLYSMGRVRLLAPLRNLAQRRLPARRGGAFRPIKDGINPIAVRELYGSSFARGWTGWMAFAMVFFAYGFGIYTFYNLIGDGLIVGVSAYLERLAMLALIPPVVAVCFVRDTEATTWDMLRNTLLLPRDVVLGKVRGVIRLLWPLFGPVYIGNCLMLGLLAIIHWNENDHMWALGFLGELFFFPIHVLMVIAAALMAVSFTRRVTTAVAAAYGGVVAGTFGFSFLQFQLFIGGGGPAGPGSIFGYGMMHAVLCGFALLLGFGIAIARVDHLWHGVFMESYAPPARRPQGPPPLPPK